MLAIKVSEEDDEVFYDCEEPMDVEVGKTGCRTFDLTTCPIKEKENEKICMVQSPIPNVVTTLDSGADMSVAPENFYALGMPGTAKPMHMVDAQGERIQSAGNRRLRLIATAKDGCSVEFVEQFALGQGVTHPLLSLDRLLRQGWVLL